MLLAQDPKLLLVDEPVAGMTDAETEETGRLLKEIAETHSVIVVEHDMHFVRGLGVKVTCLHEGSVLCRRDRSIIVSAGSHARHRSSILRESERCSRLSDATLALWRGACALRGVSLTAETGKITCVLGRNGVGKTTLMRAIVGQHRLTSGAITFDGKALDRSTPYERARLGIGFVPQGREIFPLLTVKENLETGFAPLKRDGTLHSGTCL